MANGWSVSDGLCASGRPLGVWRAAVLSPTGVQKETPTHLIGGCYLRRVPPKGRLSPVHLCSTHHGHDSRPHADTRVKQGPAPRGVLGLVGAGCRDPRGKLTKETHCTVKSYGGSQRASGDVVISI